ncbi:hypothetical protein HY990_00670 [Candidatus Micrarchaeota archaeon]|nr:hypothetical protein [Candidatus Micrarchaeota archaeon]
MTILVRGPPPGKREHVFIGDEARVSRIWRPGSRFDGMVERIQEISEIKTKSRFRIGRNQVIGTNDINYHLLKYLCSRLARTRFPGNFVDQSELRFFRRGKGPEYSATYSKFIEDTNNAKERRKKSMDNYYKTFDLDEERAKTLRDNGDQEERNKVPQMVQLIRKFEDAGFVLAHPEANYQIDAMGNVVFFEIAQIEPEKIIPGNDNLDELLQMALIYAIIVKREAKSKLEQMMSKRGSALDTASADYLGRKYLEIHIQRIQDIILTILINITREKIDLGHNTGADEYITKCIPLKEYDGRKHCDEIRERMERISDAMKSMEGEIVEPSIIRALLRPKIEHV